MDEEIKTQVVNEGATQEVAQQTEAQTAEEERFDTEYVRKLRAEAAEYRKKLRDLENKVKAEEEAKMSESERLMKRLTELEKQKAELEQARQERVLQYEVMLAASKMGIVDPEAAYKLLDLKQVEFDDDGKPTNIDTVLTELVKKRPYLGGSVARTISAGAGTGSTSQRYVNQQINDWIRKTSGR